MPEGSAPTGACRPYRWGRLFVRSATILAMVAAALGVLGAGVQCVLLRRAIEAASQRPSTELNDDVGALRAGCARAVEAIGALVGEEALPRLPGAAFPAAIRSLRDLEMAQAAMAAHERYVVELKASLLRGFPEAVDWLVASLTRKADRIRQQIQVEHSDEAARLQARIEALRRQLEDDGRGLYLPIDQAEHQRRLDVLDQAASFLEYLGTLGGGTAVDERVAAARGTLERLRSGLPEPTSEGRRLRLVQELAGVRRTLAELVKEGRKLEGEELAERLRLLCQEVVAAAESSWTVDVELRRLRQRLEAEARALTAVEEERGRLWRWGLLRAVGALLTGLGAAVLLVLVADVLSALFDTAEALVVAPGRAAETALPEGLLATTLPSGRGKRRRYLRE
jgi:hypothetical protein